MSGLVLDTNVVSHYIHPRAKVRSPRLLDRVGKLLASGEATLSRVTVYELRRGLLVDEAHGQGQRKAIKLELFIRSVVVLGLDEGGGHSWDVAAHLWAKTKAHVPAITLEEADLLIAATAIAYGRVLATCDGNLADRLDDLGLGQHVQRWKQE